MLVMPAIHNFEGNSWGWMDFDEVVKACNNVLSKRNGTFKLAYTRTIIISEFELLTHAHQQIQSAAMTWRAWGGKRHLVDGLSTNDMIRPDAQVFVPSGWAIAIVKLAEKGVVKIATSNINGDFNKRWGIREDGTTVVVKGID